MVKMTVGQQDRLAAQISCGKRLPHDRPTALAGVDDDSAAVFDVAQDVTVRLPHPKHEYFKETAVFTEHDATLQRGW
jgi:hypothetical protein